MNSHNSGPEKHSRPGNVFRDIPFIPSRMKKAILNRLRACKKYIHYYDYAPILENVDNRLRSHVADRVCLSQKHLFYYCRIPKSANSTIVRTLSRHIHGQDIYPEDPKGLLAKKELQGFRKIRGLSRQMILNQYFCFTFVRHPEARILSAYLDKVQKKSFVSRFKGAISRKMTLLNFLQALEGGLLYEDPHWAPQWAMIPFSVDELHFVGRVESIAKDMQEVVSRIFGDYRGLATRSHNRKKSSELVRQYLGSREKDLIREIYAQDYRLFYPREL